MKKILLCSIAVLTMMSGCKKNEIGYLLTENANYNAPFEVYKNADPDIDYYRYLHKSPWVSDPVNGVLGTAPIKYEVLNVTSTDGNAELMKQELTIGGRGICQFPFESKTPAGTYKVSLRVYNDGKEAVTGEVLTVIVKDSRK